MADEMYECKNCGWSGGEDEPNQALDIKVCPGCNHGLFLMDDGEEDDDSGPHEDGGDGQERDGEVDDDFDWNPTFRAGENGPVLEADGYDEYQNKDEQRDIV